MGSRVVITGMGIQAPIGRTIDEFARSLAAGVSGILESSEVFPGQTIWGGLVRAFERRDSSSTDEVEGLDRTAQLAIVAARQALADAGLRLGEPGSPALGDVGLALGTSHGGRSQLDRFVDEGNDEADADTARRLLVLAPHFQQTAAVARTFDLGGPVVTLSNACSSSGGAMAQAFELLQAGKAEVMIAGGADGFSKLTYSGFGALGAMAAGPCGPFSTKIGLSLGDGAAFVVLETLEHAQGRGARIHAELLGYGLSWDAYHITAPEPTGEGILRAINMAARTAGVGLEEIDYVNAHGTGTRSNDVAECLALKRFFQNREAISPVSATKSFTGHTLGASAAMGLITSILAMQHQILPPTLNFAAPRAGCDLDFVPNEARPGRIRYFVSESAAFGGANAVLVGGQLDPARKQPVRRTDRVVITGVGVVSPIGHGIEGFVEGLRQGRCGIGPIDRFDVSNCRCQSAALIHGFEPRQLMPTLEARRMDRISEFAAVAACGALLDARYWQTPIAPERIGLVVGTTRGAANSFEKYLESVNGQNWRKASPIYFPNLVMSSIGGQVSRALCLKGVASTVVDGVTAGLHALVHGFELLRRNDGQDAVVVVAADEIGGLFFRLLDRLGVLAETCGRGPGEALCPYDPEATGMVPGEGAVALVLERASSASGRGVTAHAEVAGYGLAGDGRSAGHPEPEPSGRHLERAIRVALEEAGIGPEGLDVVYGHGRGIRAPDQREAEALGRVLAGRPVPVGCVLGHTGVAEAASGLYSVAAAVLGMSRSEAYGLPGGSRPLVGALAYVRGGPLTGSYGRALVAGSTENGNNAAVVLTTVVVGAR
jgi:3-oxoacyl-[acyl-carrier-protein] synthase II